MIEYTNVRQKMDAYCAAAADLDVQLVFKTKSRNGKIHRRCPPERCWPQPASTALRARATR